MHILRSIDRRRFQMDFLTHTAERAEYDEEIESLGCRLLPCARPGRLIQYAQNLKRILRENGPYDVIHSHPHHFSGWVLRVAREAGIPMRVAHSHNDTSQKDQRASLIRRGYLALAGHWVSRHATHGLAASAKAARSLFGDHWQRDPRWRILYCAIDCGSFQTQVDRRAVRAELGIPEDALVVGHVGRFAEQKNHRFLLEIADEVSRRIGNMKLLLVGEGPLRPAVEEEAARLGLTDRVIYAGNRPDVAKLMRTAMDIFVLPSFFEGLPLVGIEAQAAGLPIVLSDVVTEELDVVTPNIRRLGLRQPASAWAEKIADFATNEPKVAQAEALAMIKKSPFNIATSVSMLETFYDQAAQARMAV